VPAGWRVYACVWLYCCGGAARSQTGHDGALQAVTLRAFAAVHVSISTSAHGSCRLLCAWCKQHDMLWPQQARQRAAVCFGDQV
jgi:hypothetical protein